MEQPVSFHCDELCLSGLLHRAAGDRAAIITHPHPLYGGDMHNPVVEIITRAYQSAGYSTLRFNFRGTGRSQGEFGGGTEETDDIAAAVAYLTADGMVEPELAGYSFGAWVCALGAEKFRKIRRIIMVAPPVDFTDFKDVRRIPALSAVITGSEDPFAPPERIGAMIPGWSPSARLVVIDGADHFFSGFDRELEKAMAEAVR